MTNWKKPLFLSPNANLRYRFSVVSCDLKASPAASELEAKDIFVCENSFRRPLSRAGK